MLIGSGPIVIGQACEFDYSGVQACKALKEDGYEVVLVNSNPATIMTDPDFASRTYIEPLTKDTLHEIIRRERPDAILPTLGGQTALNLAMELNDSGILKRYQVELLGANAESIRRAEDRDLFKKAMRGIGLDMPVSGSAHSMDEAKKVAEMIGSWPLIIRPGFTLGGTGGGIAHNMDEFTAIVERGLDASRNCEVLIEESLLGWKEFELEVMRDTTGNSVVICTIENLDPMGVHTGDSITVAPIQTLTDREYQWLRDGSLAVMEAIGIATGGSNVQWAVNPENGRYIIIEMNPRVSRSSALASKATGFPIAKIAAKLAVGYTLDELRNDITRETPASFEPAIDYVVTKIPRFAFEKFPAADSTLTTQMKAVGEVMAIGKNFKESLQKALRSLETGRFGFGADGKGPKITAMDDETLASEIVRPNAQRIFVIYEAFRRGWSVERIHDLSKIDRWFLRHMEELACFEDEVRKVGTVDKLAADPDLFLQAKSFGYADRQLAWLLNTTEEKVTNARLGLNLLPVYALVDTCAAEFEAHTPYYYSTWGGVDEMRPTDKPSVMILGGGPNRIGQGIEFDYCCVHASFALRSAGYESIMMNSNPETVSTDYDTSDKLYFEPLTLEDVMNVYRREKCTGIIVQFGGQTPLNLAMKLKAAGANILGTSPDHIEAAEDRDFFKKLAEKLSIRQPANGIATNVEQAVEIADRIGYPILMRPSFVLGGRAMVIVYKEKYLRKYMEEAVSVSEDRPILIDRFLEEAVELDVDCISDGETSTVGAIMEHVELAGIHSGDSACQIPTATLSKKVLEKIRQHAHALAKELNVIGLMNIQFAVKDEEVYIIEVNPRASRTVPFVSKAIGAPLAKIATLCMIGRKLKDIGFTKEIIPPYTAFKEAVFPFTKFPGVDIVLSPEMKSTGEVMGIDLSAGIAYLKSQIAAGSSLPDGGNVFISLRDADKEPAIPYVRELVELGFTVFATRGTSTLFYNNGIKTHAVFRISRGRPNLLDLLAEKRVGWIVSTPETGAESMVDEIQMRTKAVAHGIPVTTTIDGMEEALEGFRARRETGRLEVCSIQEFHRHLNNKFNL